MLGLDLEPLCYKIIPISSNPESHSATLMLESDDGVCNVVSANLERLAIRTTTYVHLEALKGLEDSEHTTPLVAATTLIGFFFISSPESPPQHLVPNIKISLFAADNLTGHPPLAISGMASLSIPRIDVYVQVRTGALTANVTRARISSSLEKCDDVTKSIKDGRTDHSYGEDSSGIEAWILPTEHLYD